MRSFQFFYLTFLLQISWVSERKTEQKILKQNSTEQNIEQKELSIIFCVILNGFCAAKTKAAYT